jgi:hypothetical protein
MRRQNKSRESKILQKGLIYPNNKKLISKTLYAEQKGFCAYTEEYIGRTDAEDIEHFNPTLKETDYDGYENWFLVKHQWNSEKSTKWEKCQPILHPTAKDFEERIVYNDGIYFAKPDDTPADNLIKLLNLNDQTLTSNRKKFIKNKREKFVKYSFDLLEHFTRKATEDPSSLKYLRAIKEEFGVDVWSLIPNPKITTKKKR